MEEKQNNSIWGSWWTPLRKWVYPVWLLYEVSIRFYDYALSTYHYFEAFLKSITSLVGNTGVQVLSIASSILTFALCTAFLTIPTCFILYKFFKVGNLTNTSLEQRMKVYF